MEPGELVDTSFHQQIKVFLLRKKNKIKNVIKRINQNIQQIKL
jgi:hypothetical protein